MLPTKNRDISGLTSRTGGLSVILLQARTDCPRQHKEELTNTRYTSIIARRDSTKAAHVVFLRPVSRARKTIKQRHIARGKVYVLTDISMIRKSLRDRAAKGAPQIWEARGKRADSETLWKAVE